MNSMILRLLFVLILLSLPVSVQARSLALIVGNDSYENVASLQKARADASGYAEFFAARGVDVTLRLDLSERDMTFELANFYDRIAPGDTVIFVYAGHGWSDGRQNYLIPTDMRAQGSETLLSQESIPLKNGVTGILDQIALRGPGLVVAIIDACRNNPFRSTDGTRSIGLARGLVDVRAPTGTFVAFSAGAGQTALDRLSDDDAVPYSVFTRHFLAELAKPQDLQSAFKATQLAVNEIASSIGHPQRPAYYDEVVGSACLTGACDVAPVAVPAPAPAQAPAADPAAAARAEWQDFKDTGSVEVLELFAQRHDGTAYAALARERIRALTLITVPTTPVPVDEPEPEPTPQAPLVQTESPKPDWCPRAATRTERAICGDPVLSALDIRMERLYLDALRTGSGARPSLVKSSQRTWLGERNKCRSDRDCIERRYEERISYLLR